MAAAALTALAMLTTAGLVVWRGWLRLKQEELHHAGPGFAAPLAGPPAGSRIEIADLKERVRKLEAIASGVDL
jgi:hypothetical protein